MSLGESIRSGATWLLFGSLGKSVMQFAIGVVLARLLTPADFGMIVTVQFFTGLAGLVAGGGMGQALIREKDVDRQDIHAVFSSQLVVGLMIYAMFFVAAPFIARSFGNPLYTELVRVSTLTFLLRPFVNIPSVILKRDMRFKATAIVGMVTGLISGAASIIMAWGGYGVWSLVLAGFIGALLGMVLLIGITRYRPRLVLDLQRSRRFAAYGLKFSSNDIVSYGHRQAANLVMSGAMGASAVGLYNKADSLVNIPFSTVSASLYEALLRGLAKVQDDLPETRRLYLRSIAVLVVYTLPIYVGMAWLAEPFILGVYGSKWAETAMPLTILAMSGLFICIGHPAGAVLAAQNMLGRELIVQLTFLGTTLLGIFFGLHWGMTGVASGIVLSRGLAAVHMTMLVSRRLPLRVRDIASAIGPGTGLSLLMLLSLWVADRLLPAGLSHDQPLMYAFVVALAGGLAYCTAFLFLPIPSLAGECTRWRRLLRLKRA